MKNAFVQSVKTTPVMTTTTNGMKTQESSMSNVVDLFYNIGSSRGKDMTGQFERAFQDDKDLALRIALWTRDVRGGAGERQLFRDILLHLEKYHPEVLTETNFLKVVPVVGRWDDLLIFKTSEVEKIAFNLIGKAIRNGDGLACKWTPRKGEVAVKLRTHLGMTPKQYRKTLVNNTKVVETALCQKNFDLINYSHVPSLAMSRYMTTFHKKDEARFIEYRNLLKKGDKSVKINASAVYPYDIIKSLRYRGDKDVNDAQWNALPNYMSDANVLPMVDVSGSMSCSAGGMPSISCLDVALSLGLYCADKNKGAFKDLFLTFSHKPELLQLKGTLSEKLVQMHGSNWEMNTNIEAAFDRILSLAVRNKVPQSDMPKYLLILSDMQFDAAVGKNYSIGQLIRSKYQQAGYELPVIVFWNINAAYGNTPVSFDAQGTCLVSGFSPAIMKAVLSMDLEEFSPINVVKKAVQIDRYNWE